MNKILLIMGTRPEIIKMAPLYLDLKEHCNYETRVLYTGQHESLASNIFDFFGIIPDYKLKTMKSGQALAQLSTNILNQTDEVIKDFAPDVALVHGDTTTSAMGSLACFYNKVDVCHIEAGLRSGDNMSPWPEEINRKINAQISKLHFAPTERARNNLIRENIPGKHIFVVGNTVVDSISRIRKILSERHDIVEKIEKKYNFLTHGKQFVLVTFHRRENFGKGFNDFVFALKKLARLYPEINFVWPVHPNPEIRENVNTLVESISNIIIVEPIDYLDFVYCLSKCDIVMTDSGGIQEEVCSLNKRAIVLRTVTERTEAVESGHCVLTGTDPEKIICEFNRLINTSEISSFINPFGDGQASRKIIDIMVEKF